MTRRQEQLLALALAVGTVSTAIFAVIGMVTVSAWLVEWMAR